MHGNERPPSLGSHWFLRIHIGLCWNVRSLSKLCTMRWRITCLISAATYCNITIHYEEFYSAANRCSTCYWQKHPTVFQIILACAASERIAWTLFARNIYLEKKDWNRFSQLPVDLKFFYSCFFFSFLFLFCYVSNPSFTSWLQTQKDMLYCCFSLFSISSFHVCFLPKLRCLSRNTKRIDRRAHLHHILRTAHKNTFHCYFSNTVQSCYSLRSVWMKHLTFFSRLTHRKYMRQST